LYIPRSSRGRGAAIVILYNNFVPLQQALRLWHVVPSTVPSMLLLLWLMLLLMMLLLLLLLQKYIYIYTCMYIYVCVYFSPTNNLMSTAIYISCI